MRLSEMSFSLLVRLEKGLDLCEAISLEKSVGAVSCIYLTCPFRYLYEWKRVCICVRRFLMKNQ